MAFDTPTDTPTDATEVQPETPPETNGEVAAYDTADAAITDINQLDLQTEPMQDVDMDKLEENMEYAPSLTPGVYHDFIFKLSAEKPWEGVTMKTKLEASFNWEAQHIKDDGTPGRTIRFQRANTFRSGKMEASRADELLFALGKMPAFKRTERKRGDILRLLMEASEEQIVIRGLVQWRHYDKGTGVTTSTHPAKPYKKIDKNSGQEITVTEQPWPKDEKGKFMRHPGNEEIARVSPTKETLDKMKAEKAGAA